VPTRPDIFPVLALKQTRDPALLALFTQLCERVKVYARLHDEFSDAIVKHREAREGKRFHYTKAQEEFLRAAESDAEQANLDLEAQVKRMDDVHLLAFTLLGEKQQLATDEWMFAGWHQDNRAMAEQLLNFGRATIDLIQQTIQSFHSRREVEAVIRLLSPKPKSEPGAAPSRRHACARRCSGPMEGGAR
jgi:hypothetical protein